jgi:lysozyme
MNIDENGIQMIEGFEGLRLTAYQDARDIWTIGYGHTGPDVKPGLTITREEAQAFLEQDVAKAMWAINQAVKVPLTQGEFDALSDFVYNAGIGAFGTSTLLKKLNAGDYAGAAAEFDKWDHAGARLCSGLLRRRQAETAEFSGVTA